MLVPLIFDYSRLETSSSGFIIEMLRGFVVFFFPFLSSFGDSDRSFFFFSGRFFMSLGQLVPIMVPVQFCDVSSLPQYFFLFSRWRPPLPLNLGELPMDSGE